MRPPETFETERLRLRRLRASDAYAIYERYAQDPEVSKYLTWRPHQSPDEAIVHVERVVQQWEEGSKYAWIIEDRQAHRLLGSIAAHPTLGRVELGYLLARDAWGNGYMPEAVTAVTEWFLSQPEVFRVWALCDVENTGSARVLEKAGFQLEGILRRWMVHPNVSSTPRDSMCYSRIVD